MKKAAFFPYHDDLQMLASFKDCLTDWEIVGFLSYKEDKPLVDRLNAQYGLIEKSPDEILSICDVLIILDNHRDFRTEKYYQVIETAITAKKEILITPYAVAQLELDRYTGEYRLLQRYPDNGLESYDVCKKRFCDISIPAIAVMGQGKNCGKFECQTFLWSVLSKDYKTVVLSGNSLGAMFGFYTLPEFFFEAIPFEEKVVKINYYIRAIIQQEKPDIVILGVPEGVVPTEQDDFNHFGEYALVTTSAISVDLSILSMYYMSKEINEEGIGSVTAFCREKFRIPQVSVFMSNMLYDKPQDGLEVFIYEYLDDGFYQKHHPDFGKCSTQVFSMKDKQQAKEAVFKMLQPLRDNLNIIL